MSQSNEINFGPVFMRGRKPAPITNKTNPISNNPPGPAQAILSQPYKPTGGPTVAMMKPNQHPPSATSSPAANASSLPLPKSFSAAVSPGKETENRPHSNGTQWDTNAHHSPDPSSPRISPATDYSREALLNLYSEYLAAKLPPDLEINDPAVSLEFVGPPLALIEMTEAEKDLFSGPFNSEKRPAGNKATPHHTAQDHSLGLTLSPETGTNHGLPNNRLSVGGTVKLGKHSSTERFNSLGIQGGVLAGVASSTHSNPRRKGDQELDPSEAQRRFQRTEDAVANTGPWSVNLRDRRTRDSGPPVDGKWKRGISFEEKIQSQDSSGGSNLKYSVLDKIREKAALEMASKEAQQSPPPATQNEYEPKGGDQLPLHASSHSKSQPWGSGENLAIAPRIEEKASSSTPNKNDPSTPANASNQPESIVGLAPGTGSESSIAQPSSNDMNPEDIAWQYRDPSGTVQGPFTAFQMQEWYKAAFFREDLLVKRVIDAAFETLETLILRVGDRDRPFLARPPPALPPNLTLPHGHSHNRQLHTSQPSPQLHTSNFLDQASANAPPTDNSSVVGRSLIGNSSTASTQLGGVPTLDPWNNIPARSSPLTRPGTLLASQPAVSGIGWNPSLPAFAHPPAVQNNDYEINDGIIEFNPHMLDLEIIPSPPSSNSYVQPNDLQLAFLQQMRNGYPIPIPPLQVPNFGQIPPMPPLANSSAMGQMLATHLQARFFNSLLFNPPVGSGVNGPEPQIERPALDNFASSANHVDPWQASPQPSNSLAASGQNHLESILVNPSQNQTALPSNPGDRAMPHLAASADVIPEPRPAVKLTSGLESHERNIPSVNAEVRSQQISAVNSQLDSKAFPVSESRATASTSSSKLAPKKQEINVNTTEVPLPAAHILSESNSQDKLTSKSSSLNAASTQRDSTPGFSATSDSNQSWQNVTYHPAAQQPNGAQTPGPLIPTSSVPKSTGKVVVLSKAQQDEQDRRTASIQKTQLQLKEAQAVERAAREASEAAAAAVSASFNTPAPWSKEEKPSTHISLTEIQAIEAKQAEKRRLVEKQAAINRVMAAERASKTVIKEALPSTSNWAATASSPVKSSTGTVWRPKESEGPTIANGPKQSMKQIQEEEARKKSMALQQASKSAGSGVAKPAGGYAGTVASAKPAVGGPWSVVGAKSKVIAPPTTSSPSTAIGNAAVAPVTSRTGFATGTVNKPTPKMPLSVSKTPSKPPQTTSVANATINNSSNTATNNPNADGPPPASPEFMKWLREALRGMNNVEDFVKMLLDFPINPDESVLEIVSDSVYAGSATLDGRRFAKEFNARRMADVASRNKGAAGASMKNGDGSPPVANGTSGTGLQTKKAGNFPGFSSTTTMADAVKFQPGPKNDGWGFAVVGAKKKKK